MSMEDYPPRKRTELQLARHHQLPECSRFSGSQAESDTLKKSHSCWLTGRGDPDSDFCGSAEQTLSVPSGFSLDVWPDRTQGHPRSAQ